MPTQPRNKNPVEPVGTTALDGLEPPTNDMVTCDPVITPSPSVFATKPPNAVTVLFKEKVNFSWFELNVESAFGRAESPLLSPAVAVQS